MTFSRYSRAPILGLNKLYGTTKIGSIIRDGISLGLIKTKESVLIEGQRLDTIAGQEYGGQADLYWVIAAASGIGWPLQVPPGTKLVIPDLDDVANLLS